MGNAFEFQTSLGFGDSLNFIEESDSATAEKKRTLFDNSVTKKIAAIHETTTSNFTTYTAEELRKAAETWTKPYDKPVLTHHQSKSGEPIGRVKEAKYFNNMPQANRPGHQLVVEITDPEAIKKIEDGRYKTVSVGGQAEHAICSICGADWVEEGWCSHMPGSLYEDELAHLVLKELDFKEVSFVNVPADEYAQLISESDDNINDNNSSISSVQSYVGNNKSNQENKSWNYKESSVNTEGGNDMDLEEKIEILQEKLETKEDKIEILEDKNSSLNKKLEEKENTVDSLHDKIETLQDKKELLEEEMDDVVEENNKLRELHHKRLAEDVVDKKIKIGMLTKEEKEESLDEHIDRTEDSLADSLNDLEKQLKKLQEEAEAEEDDKSEIGEKIEEGDEINLEEEGVEQEGDSEGIDEKIRKMLGAR